MSSVGTQPRTWIRPSDETATVYYTENNSAGTGPTPEYHRARILRRMHEVLDPIFIRIFEKELKKNGYENGHDVKARR